MTPASRHPHVRRFDAWFEVLLSGLAALLAVLAGVYAIRLLVSGVQVTTVPENLPGAPYPAPGSTGYERYPAAWAPLAAAVLVLIGLCSRRLSFAWAGALLLLGFSLLFVFSSGGGFLPLAGLLIALLLILHIFRSWRLERSG